MNEVITSIQNPKIKNVVKLIEKQSERKTQGLIVVEGAREINLALAANYKLKTLFNCVAVSSIKGDKVNADPLLTVEISKEVFAKLAYREGSDGLLALFEPKQQTLDTFVLSANPLIIILEAVEKPGNLGAILRTADAAGIDGLIICDPKTDIYNPNVIRSSVGCLFTTQVVADTSENIMQWLNHKKITTYAAALTATQAYTAMNFAAPTAIVFGTEADGLSDKWLTTVQQIKIPMLGKIDSLNVSVSAAVMVYEALRQRLATA
jgi:RNA methyltransferase, TrmH family